MRPAIAIALLLMLKAGMAAAAEPGPGQSLHRMHVELEPQLAANAFGRPLHLDSRESNEELEGDIHAVVAYPFAAVRDALGDPEGWCDILILQFNTKRCQVQAGQPPELVVNVGRKVD